MHQLKFSVATVITLGGSLLLISGCNAEAPEPIEIETANDDTKISEDPTIKLTSDKTFSLEEKQKAIAEIETELGLEPSKGPSDLVMRIYWKEDPLYVNRDQYKKIIKMLRERYELMMFGGLGDGPCPPTEENCFG